LPQPIEGLTLEEQQTIEFLGSCGALEALVCARFYQQRSAQMTRGFERLGLPIK
jgi:hypothetical protein